MNKQWLMGNIVEDAKVAVVGQDGKNVANFRLATNEGIGDSKVTDYHNVVAWGPLAEEAAVKARKGVRVMVEGRARTRTYEKNGEKRYVTECVANKVEYLVADEKEFEGLSF